MFISDLLTAAVIEEQMPTYTFSSSRPFLNILALKQRKRRSGFMPFPSVWVHSECKQPQPNLNFVNNSILHDKFFLLSWLYDIKSLVKNQNICSHIPWGYLLKNWQLKVTQVIRMESNLQIVQILKSFFFFFSLCLSLACHND